MQPVNLFGYVGGNPVTRIDPYGLFDWINPTVPGTET